MISSSGKKIIILGHYPLQRRKWYSLLDEDVDWYEFCGHKYNSSLKSFDTDTNIFDSNAISPNGDNGRVVDSFEYVVRFFPNKIINHARGLKVDILSIQNNYHINLVNRIGVPNIDKNFNLDAIGNVPDEYNSITHVSSFVNNGHDTVREYWLTLNCGNHNNKVSDKHLSLLNDNVNFLSCEDYLLLSKEVKSCVVNYNDILNTRWAKTIKEQRINKLVTKEFLAHFSNSFIGVQNSFQVSRGIQTIFIAMNDSRFKEYEIYIDGFFNIGNSDLINLSFGEYLLISKWINNGDIKFFPEHVESERSLYVNQATKAGINLHGVK